jgi:hypothetical protein
MKVLAYLIICLGISSIAIGSESTQKTTKAKNVINLRAKSQERKQAHPYVFLAGPKSVVVPCVEDTTSKTVEEALLIASTALAQKEFLCVDVRKPTSELGLRMCKDGDANDLMLGVGASKLECLQLLDFVIQTTVASKATETQAAP